MYLTGGSRDTQGVGDGVLYGVLCGVLCGVHTLPVAMAKRSESASEAEKAQHDPHLHQDWARPQERPALATSAPSICTKTPWQHLHQASAPRLGSPLPHLAAACGPAAGTPPTSAPGLGCALRLVADRVDQSRPLRARVERRRDRRRLRSGTLVGNIM